MADERIDIVVSDKIDASAITKIKELAKAARDAHSSVQGLAAGVSSLTKQQAQAAVAQQQVAAATAKAQAATTQAATANAQLATAQAQNAAQAVRLKQAQDNAARAAIALAAAQERQTQAAAKQAQQTTQTTAAVTKSGAAALPVGMQFQQAGYQVNDFFVQIQGGQNPLVAFNQQASQMLGAFGMWGALAAAALAIGAVTYSVIAGTDAQKKYKLGVEETTRTIELLASVGRAHREGMVDEVRKIEDLVRGYNNLSAAQKEAVRTQEANTQREGLRERDRLLAQAGGVGWNRDDIAGTNIRAYANEKRAIDERNRAIEEANRLYGTNVALMQTGLTPQLTIAADAYNKLRDSGGATTETMSQYVVELNRAIALGGPNTESLIRQRDAVLALREKTQEHETAMRSSLSIIGDSTGALAAYGVAAGNAAGGLDKLIAAEQRLAQEKRNAALAIDPTTSLAEQASGQQRILQAYQRGSAEGRREEARQRVAERARSGANTAASQYRQDLTEKGITGAEADRMVEARSSEIESMARQVAENEALIAGRRIDIQESGKAAAAANKNAREVESLTNRLASLVNGIDKTAGASLMQEKAERTLNEALGKGIITRDKYNQYMEATRRTYEEQANPLGKLLKDLDTQANLLRLNNREREVEMQVQQSIEAMRDKGRVLSQDEVNNLRARYTGLQELNRQSEVYNSLLNAYVEPQENFNRTLAAAGTLFAQNKITADQYATAVANAQMAALRGTNSVENGLKLGVIQIAQDAADTTQNTAYAVQSAFSMMSNAVSGFVRTGKFELSDFAGTFAGMIAEMLMRAAALRAIGIFTPGLLGGAGVSSSVGSAVASGGFTSLASGVASGGMMGFAQGGAFNNGIIQRPSSFETGRGRADIGERSPEAIMPLMKLSDGSLGVGAVGGGNSGGQQFNIPINVVVEGGSQGSEADARLGNMIGEQLERRMTQIIDTRIAHQSRTGGMLRR